MGLRLQKMSSVPAVLPGPRVACLMIVLMALIGDASAFTASLSSLPAHMRLRGGAGISGSARGLVCMASMAERIESKLAKLNPTRLVIVDDSSKHAGHSGVGGRSGETHYKVDIESEEFEGKRLVQRHQMVYALLNEEMDLNNSGVGIHALQINAKAPGEEKK